MNGRSALNWIATCAWPETGSALDRAEAMVEPAILAGAFGDSRTLAVCGLQYHLGGAEDTRQLAELAGITAADHVLDVACFLGGPALQLAETYGCQVTGVDLSPVAIAGARRIAQHAGLEHLLHYDIADAAHMPYPDGAFSVIWNQGSLNHDPAWLDEFDRVLRPGGRLALVFEHRPEQGPRHEADSRWTMAETAARVAALGYEIRHLDDLTEREIALGWERMIRRLDERREVYLAAKGAEWIEAAKRVHRGNRRHAPAGVEQRAPDRDETRRRIGMKLTREQLFDIAATVPQRQGWDYSQVRDAREPVPWDYVDVVRRYLKPGDRVLDCGTGGGERFLSLSDAYRLGVGLDPDPEMLEVAQANADRDGVSRVEWVEGCGEALPVADNSMDVVLNRHAVIDPVETLRVLRPSGLLIMQEVGARNLQAICTTFGCGPGGEYVFAPADSIYRLADRFRALGSTVLAVAEYDVPYTLLDIPSLLFLLRGVGIPEDYDLGRHWPQVLDIIERCGTHEGIVTNEHRELLIVRKGLASRN